MIAYKNFKIQVAISTTSWTSNISAVCQNKNGGISGFLVKKTKEKASRNPKMKSNVIARGYMRSHSMIDRI